MVTRRRNGWRRRHTGATPRILICITGIDGSGKTTQARMLASRLQAVGIDTTLIWGGSHRYVTGAVVKVAKRLWGVQYPAGDADTEAVSAGDESTGPGQHVRAANRLFRRHTLIRRAWIHISLLEHAAELNAKILPSFVCGKALVSDRYLYRTVINLAVMLDIAPSQLSRLLSHVAFRLVPKPTLAFLLDSPSVTAVERTVQRGHDVPHVNYVRPREVLYRAIADCASLQVIDATQPPDIVADEIWKVVSSLLPERTIRR
jgi:thymidylate kinase